VIGGTSLKMARRGNGQPVRHRHMSEQRDPADATYQLKKYFESSLSRDL
jgi:hypothetical protein